MRHYTPKEKTNQRHARSLLADVHGATDRIIPRREAIVDWLNAYLLRSDRQGYEMGRTEADDLIALDQFLRSHQVPVAAGPAV